MIPINREGKIVLVRQHRYLFNEETIEFPAGKIDEGEGAEASARRELKEEVGYKADELIPLGELYLSVGLSNGKAHVFLARGLTLVGASPEEITRLIARGEM
ncbi:NUDIX hydrolase, partial [bacterium]|nr:NUDIX hydrolase [bacterium]